MGNGTRNTEVLYPMPSTSGRGMNYSKDRIEFGAGGASLCSPNNICFVKPPSNPFDGGLFCVVLQTNWRYLVGESTTIHPLLTCGVYHHFTYCWQGFISTIAGPRFSGSSTKYG